MKPSRGFTLLELVLAVGLTTVLAVVGIGSISRSKQREDLLSVVIRIVQTLQLAQERSMSGAKDTSWKVILGESMVQVSDISGNRQEFYQLPPGDRLMTGGVMEINFARPTGLAQECGSGCTFEVRSNNANVVYQFRILSSGVVEY